jgi:hypothetical protein
MLLAGAGNETTTKLIGWTGYLLGAHPDQRRAARRRSRSHPRRHRGDPALRGALPGPGPLGDTRDVELHGTTVPEGSILLMLNAAANRDERQFDDPDRFDVRRAIDHHVTFGFGLHFCMGAALARLEGGWPSKRSWPASPTGRSITPTPSACTPRPSGAGTGCPCSCSARTDRDKRTRYRSGLTGTRSHRALSRPPANSR